MIPKVGVAYRRNDPVGFWARVRIDSSGCWIWQGARLKMGYGRLAWGPVSGRCESAHRVSYSLIHGQIPTDCCVLHTCDNPPCVNPDHLFLGTRRDNTQDMIKKGRSRLGTNQIRGVQSPHAKLTEEDVRKIRRLLRFGSSQAWLARRFGVRHNVIYQIKVGKGWKHVR